MRTHTYRQIILIVVFLIIMGIGPGTRHGLAQNLLSKGQLVYVPVYSHIYHGDKERQFNLTITLSIRNTNLEKDIALQVIDYYDSNGELLKKYLETPMVLNKFTSVRYIIKAKETSGGSGAKFIVKWASKDLVNPPLIEAIMISTQGGQGISFVSRGLVVQE